MNPPRLAEAWRELIPKKPGIAARPGKCGQVPVWPGNMARCPCIKPWGVAPPGHSEAARQSEDGHQRPHAPGGHPSPGFSCQVTAPALTTGFVPALSSAVCMIKGTKSPHQGFPLHLLSGHCTYIGTSPKIHLSCTYIRGVSYNAPIFYFYDRKYFNVSKNLCSDPTFPTMIW